MLHDELAKTHVPNAELDDGLLSAAAAGGARDDAPQFTRESISRLLRRGVFALLFFAEV